MKTKTRIDNREIRQIREKGFLQICSRISRISRFTIIENVPKDRLALRVRKPPQMDHDKVLDELKFDDSWVEIIK